MNKKPLAQFAELLEALDTSVRIASINAYQAALTRLATGPSLTLSGIKLPWESLLPRETLQPTRIALSLPLSFTRRSVSLSPTSGIFHQRQRATLRIAWKRTLAPEGSSLVRTKAELEISKKE